MKMRVTANYKKDGEMRTPQEIIVEKDGEIFDFKEKCNCFADLMGYDVEYSYTIVE